MARRKQCATARRAHAMDGAGMPVAGHEEQLLLLRAEDSCTSRRPNGANQRRRRACAKAASKAEGTACRLCWRQRDDSVRQCLHVQIASLRTGRRLRVVQTHEQGRDVAGTGWLAHPVPFWNLDVLQARRSHAALLRGVWPRRRRNSWDDGVPRSILAWRLARVAPDVQRDPPRRARICRRLPRHQFTWCDSVGPQARLDSASGQRCILQRRRGRWLAARVPSALLSAFARHRPLGSAEDFDLQTQHCLLGTTCVVS